MAEKSMFFRSFGDRRYYSSDWAKYFSTLIKGGIFGEQLDSLEVTAAGDSMNSTVKSGRAFIEGYFYENDSDLELTHEAADPVNDRIDRVVLRLDLNDENRYIKAFVRKGEVNVNPVPPEPVREGNIHEISLAQVRVRAASGIILADDITDERDNEAICGYVRYQAKPAWYPKGAVPLDAWLYVHFPDQLTPQEKADIEDNPLLMNIINGDTFYTHKKMFDKSVYTILQNRIQLVALSDLGVIGNFYAYGNRLLITTGSSFSIIDISDLSNINALYTGALPISPSSIARVGDYFYIVHSRYKSSGTEGVLVELYQFPINGGVATLIGSFYSYEIANDNYKPISPVICSDGQYLYILGGHYYDGSSDSYYKRLWRYNLSNDTASTLYSQTNSTSTVGDKYLWYDKATHSINYNRDGIQKYNYNISSGTHSSGWSEPLNNYINRDAGDNHILYIEDYASSGNGFVRITNKDTGQSVTTTYIPYSKGLKYNTSHKMILICSQSAIFGLLAEF